MSFKLPVPEADGSVSLVSCIENRRSVREYTKASVPIESLAQLLWAAQGTTGSDHKRTTPSAGGLYPLHLRILVRRVLDLDPGIYEYQCVNHSVKLLSDLVADELFQEIGIGDQPWLNEASLVVGIAAKLEDSVKHFESQPPPGKRGSRYVYMESGALAQNVHLQCTALGLGCVLVGGFDDFKAKEAFGLSSCMEITALICIGQRRGD